VLFGETILAILHSCLVVLKVVQLHEEINPLWVHLVLAPPDGLVQIHLHVRRVEARVHLEVSLDRRPETLHPVRRLVLRGTTTLLRLVHHPVRVKVLQPVVAPPKVCKNLCSLLHVLENNLRKSLFGPVFDKNCPCLFGAPLIKTKDPYLVLLTVSGDCCEHRLIDLNSAPVLAQLAFAI